MEQRTDYIVQTTPPLPQPAIRRGKKAMYRVRDGAKRAKMFRGQGLSTTLGDEYIAKVVCTAANDRVKIQMMNLALSLVDAAEEVTRLREQLNAAEALIEEMDHGKAIG